MFILVYMKRFSTDLLKVHNPSLSIQSLFKQITAFVYLQIHLNSALYFTISTFLSLAITCQ